MNNWLIDFRNKRKLTQDEVARLADMPRTTYSSIEQGRRRPSVKNAMRIASVLGFEWTYFFDPDVRETTHDKEVI